jgi:hypothetical protein
MHHVIVRTLSNNAELEIYRLSLSSSIGTYNGKPITNVKSFFDAHENTTTVTVGTRFAQPPYIYWQSSDLSLFEPSYASALASRLKIPFTPTDTAATTTVPTASGNAYRASTYASIPVPTSAPSSTDSSPKSKPQFDVGATVGMTIGAALALAIAAILIYKCLRRRKSAKDTHQEDGAVQPSGNGKYDGQDATHTISELPSPVPHQKEMYGNGLDEQTISELPSPVPQHMDMHHAGLHAQTVSELPRSIAEMDGGSMWKDR